MYFKIFLFISCFFCPAYFDILEGQETPLSAPATPQPPQLAEASTTDHVIKIKGQTLEYTAIAGTLNLKDEKGQPKASIFFVAYLKKTDPIEKQRPLTFCFNGGPGAAAVWLHMGMLGPKRVLLNQDKFTPPPYSYIDNEYSLLDTSDLVFIDPVSTGYSRAAPGEDLKQFHGVEEDIKSVGEFIHLFTTRYERWDSPKFIAGESYGTTRAAGLAEHLLDKYKLYLNGVVLISTVLDFQTISFDEGNDLAYILYLPSYTATAWYHQKLSSDLQKDLKTTLAEAERFAFNDYALALLKGDALEPAKKDEVIKKVSKYTGLPESVVKRANLRLDMARFATELLRDHKQILGRFDSRFVGFQENAWGDYRGYDPSTAAIFGAFTATFMEYIRKDLKWTRDDQYQVLTSISHWNYGNASNSYLNMSENLRNCMTKNPALKVYVASGFYDLATPYFATRYTFDHLGLEASLRNHVTYGFFESGHMMYVHIPSLEKLKSDLTEFYKSAK